MFNRRKATLPEKLKIAIDKKTEKLTKQLDSLTAKGVEKTDSEFKRLNREISTCTRISNDLDYISERFDEYFKVISDAIDEYNSKRNFDTLYKTVIIRNKYDGKVLLLSRDIDKVIKRAKKLLQK